ncbi:O-linked N-acetylglucosamine transferase, SPINDLY family protein [Lysobacter sp. A3-1-A15]|uniref:O-linked N-acetylglucosamine transferase, SPINDLY family protein n=1 Tax=Novilysobacter viscosus TaxID=3098602 RepID=UPI002ED8121E
MDQTLLARARQFLPRGRIDLALQALAPALQAVPVPAESLKLLARLALHQQLMPLAKQALQRAMAELPDDPETHALVAAAARIQGQPDALEAAARRALALDPGHPVAAALLSEHLRDRLRLGEAREVTDACLAVRPDDYGTRLARAGLQMFSGDAAAAMADADVARQQSPSLQARQVACMASLYVDRLDARQVMARHLEVGASIPPLTLPLAPRRPYAPGHRPLRIGLLSPDLRRHPVGSFIAPLLAGLPRPRTHAICFSDAAPDDASRRLQGFADTWHDTRALDDTRVFRLIQSEAIDVLVDLAGHTHGSRPALLASRTAPLQVVYLGYLHDTGMAGCDGVVGDALTLPSGTASARAPLRLPGCFLCFEPAPDAPPVCERPAAGEVVFGSFNHLAKLSPDTVSLWSALVQRVPGSRLVLCALGLQDESVRRGVRARFAAHGVGDGRLELRAPVTDPAAFLRQYDDIDIALDPLPFNGGTTTLQALWQGVPVLSCPRDTMASRSGASILHAAGLGDWVASGGADFIARGERLASDAGLRATLRATLRASMRERIQAAGLTDGPRFAQGFVALLESTLLARNAG